jgi:hypothetical protein
VDPAAHASRRFSSIFMRGEHTRRDAMKNRAPPMESVRFTVPERPPWRGWQIVVKVFRVIGMPSA